MTLEQIREAAHRVVQYRHWEQLPWTDAWNGTYPLKPSEAEVEAAYEELLALARDVIADEVNDHFWGTSEFLECWERFGKSRTEDERSLMEVLSRLEAKSTGGDGHPLTLPQEAIIPCG